MAFAPGQKITAADFNDLITQLNEVNGIGAGNKGYGAPELPLVDPFPFDPGADKVKADDLSITNDFADLSNAIGLMGQHQGDVPPLPTINQPGDDIEVGNPIQAFAEFQPAIDQVTLNRLNVDTGSTTLTSPILTSIRTEPFSTQIEHVFTVEFGSDDNARHFFNTGGEIRVAMTAPNTPEAHNWGGIFDAQGTYIFNAGEYFALSPTINNFTTALITASGGGVYSATYPASSNQWIIRTRFIAGSSTNGARGSKIEFTSVVDDQFAGSPDIVEGTFTSTISELRSTTFFGRPSPIFETVSNLGSFSELVISGEPIYKIDNSLMFDETRNMSLIRTFGVATNTKKFTLSLWTKRGNLGGVIRRLFAGDGSGLNDEDQFGFDAADKLSLTLNGAGAFTTTSVFRDPISWYHIVLEIDVTLAIANDRVKLYVNGIQIIDFDSKVNPPQNVDLPGFNRARPHFISRNSVADIEHYDGYITETIFIDGQALDVGNFGAFNDDGEWAPIDPSTLTFGNNGFHIDYEIENVDLITASVGDVGATLSPNNAKDGNPITLFQTSSTPAINDVILNYDLIVAATIKEIQIIGYRQLSNVAGVSFRIEYSSDNFGGDINVFDTFKSVSPGNVSQDFILNDEATARFWRVVANQNHNDSVEINEFTLFTSNVGSDISGNNNDFELINGTSDDQTEDSPSHNYCVLNPLFGGLDFVYSNGNLNLRQATEFGGPIGEISFGTIAVSSGKYYWEGTVSGAASGNLNGFGFGVTETITDPLQTHIVATDGVYVYDSETGAFADNGVQSPYGNTFTNGDIISVALDMDNGNMFFAKNGVWQNGATANEISLGDGTNAAKSDFNGETVWPMFGDRTNVTFVNYDTNFGQRDYTFVPPSGFGSLSTDRLTSPDIDDPRLFFTPIKYTGTGTTRSIGNIPFPPDFTWIKNRDIGTSHSLHDRVRGATKKLNSNTLASEITDIESMSSFNPDGFSIGDDPSVNGANNEIISWNWKEGTTPGFNIVTYTGTGIAKTVPHGLGAVPKFIILKSRTSAFEWKVFHTDLVVTDYLVLDTNSSKTNIQNPFNNTAPTGAVFSVSNIGAGSNESGNNFIAYLWSEIEGFSKFGSYIGNGSTDGPFVYCGFRPAFIMLKRTDSPNNWVIHDTTRNINNTTNRGLFPDLSSGEIIQPTGSGEIDFLANGFKLRNTGPSFNANLGNYIFAAFADAPLKTANAFGPGKPPIEPAASTVIAGGKLGPEIQIDNSLLFEDSKTTFLEKTFGVATDVNKWTFSGWIKRTKTGTTQTIFGGGYAGSFATQDSTNILFRSDNKLEINAQASNVTSWQLRTTQVFTNTDWTHIQISFDNAQAASANRIKIYVDGVQITIFDINNQPGLGEQGFINLARRHTFGTLEENGSDLQFFDGYQAESFFIDGQALPPTEFGEFVDILGWQPIKYTGSFGNNGFHLDFDDNNPVGDLGLDVSGNGNNFTPFNFTIDDQVLDTPTEDYVTYNQTIKSAALSLSRGNLNISGSTTPNGIEQGALSTIGVSSGKWYYEIKRTVVGSASRGILFGFAELDVNLDLNPPDTAKMFAYGEGSGNKFGNGTSGPYGASWGLTNLSDVAAVALDMDLGTMEFFKNGISQGIAFNTGISGLGKTLYPITSVSNGGGVTSAVSTWEMNPGTFGFQFPAPAGFLPITEANILNCIKQTLFDVDLFSEFGNPVNPTNFTYIVPSLITIGSTDTVISSVTTGNLPVGSNLTIVNEGRIQGKGGNGRRGGGQVTLDGLSGLPGGDALDLTLDVIIINSNGEIFGGGGAGGGGGGSPAGRGGAGGGGAGTIAGLGGNTEGISIASPGTANVGGAGSSGSGGGGNGGNGGGPGLAGQNATNGSFGTGGIGGGAGKAIDLNGNNIIFIGGNTDPNVKGVIS